MKEYSLVIASNFLDHYMLSLSRELMKCFPGFCFVASKKLEERYQKLGFSDLNRNDFVFRAYEDRNKAKQIILDADIVITGSYAYQDHIRARRSLNKPIIYYSERLFKTDNRFLNFLRFIKYNLRHGKDREAPLLCVSGYTAGDYNSIGLFKDRTYKFGYFPEVKKYNDVKELIENKKKNSLIWVGRLITWKHPDYALLIAKKLKEEGYSFSMEMIGNGEMKDTIHSLISQYELGDHVTVYDSGMAPEDVRKHMEASEIYLFTSDRGEGWGVVLNEAMNSACACVASFSAGSTPFLLEDGKNGSVYCNEDTEDLYRKVKDLIDHQEKKRELAKKAYESITDQWNCEVAAERIYHMAECIMNKKEYSDLYEDGILSRALPLE